MSKFSKSFAEVRLYIPLESDSWEMLQDTNLADLLTQSGKLAIFKTQVTSKQKKGGSNNAQKS